MFAVEVLRARLVDFLPLHSIGVPILAVEESAFGRFDQQAIWILTVGKDVGIKALVGQLRSEQSARIRNVAMLRRKLISALMEVWGGGLRGKSIQSEVVKLLGENGEGHRCRLGFINLEIQLAEGVEALELHVALKRRKAFDGCANEAVFKR